MYAAFAGGFHPLIIGERVLRSNTLHQPPTPRCFHPLIIGERVLSSGFQSSAAVVARFPSPHHRGARSEQAEEERVSTAPCFHPLIIGERVLSERASRNLGGIRAVSIPSSSGSAF